MLLSDIKSFFSFLKPSNLKGWFNVENVFMNYFWFYSVFAISLLLSSQGTLFNLGFPIILCTLLIKNYKRIPYYNIIDILWILDFVWILLGWLLNDYPHKLYLVFKTCCQELAYMMAYWIVRCNNVNYVQIIIEKAYKPLTIACIIGIYCFFFEPVWYQTAIEGVIERAYGGVKLSQNQLLEQFRLRSFYNSTYVLAYFCAITLIYEFFILFKYNKRSLAGYNYHLLFVALLFVTGILCMMRGPLICALIGAFIAYVYSILFFKGKHSTKKILYMLSIVGLCFIIIYSYIDIATIEFMYDKIDMVADGSEDFILNRMYTQAQSFSITGEGYGKYGTFSFYKFGMPFIPDSEYMKICGEQGYIGVILIISMFGFGFIKTCIYFKDLYIELCLIFMLAVCMMGADPLSIPDKHCFLYWMALGQVSRYKCIKQ